MPNLPPAPRVDEIGGTPPDATMPKLNYTLVGRETVNTAFGPLVRVHVEWRHADGPIADFKVVPKTHPPDVVYETVPDGSREVVHDQVDVPPGTPDSIVAMKCEEKREALARNLGVEP